jgi:phosphoribosyl-ATP pyrophosphohydrolase/phosphoribosyl-AMP cyclohydrolase
MKKDLFRAFKKIGPETRGLVPVVVQDRTSREVLMVAYMDRGAFEATLRTGQSHFYSRSRKRLWRKGEESGHTQKVQEIFIDCDGDTLLLRVDSKGPACHTGKPSCFFTRLSNGRPSRPAPKGDSKILERLFEVIQDRSDRPSKSSYVSGLFAGGEDRVLKKVGEEAGEFLLASKGGGKEQIIHEAADLLFHLLAALNYEKIPLDRIFAELEGRFGRSGLEEKKRRRRRK